MLSQDDNSWIDENTKVYNRVVISGNAYVSKSEIHTYYKIEDNVVIKDSKNF